MYAHLKQSIKTAARFDCVAATSGSSNAAGTASFISLLAAVNKLICSSDTTC